MTEETPLIFVSKSVDGDGHSWTVEFSFNKGASFGRGPRTVVLFTSHPDSLS